MNEWMQQLENLLIFLERKINFFSHFNQKNRLENDFYHIFDDNNGFNDFGYWEKENQRIIQLKTNIISVFFDDVLLLF